MILLGFLYGYDALRGCRSLENQAVSKIYKIRPNFIPLKKLNVLYVNHLDPFIEFLIVFIMLILRKLPLPSLEKRWRFFYVFLL